MMPDSLQVFLFGMVLKLCKSYGMNAADVNKLFNKKTIDGGMKILNESE